MIIRENENLKIGGGWVGGLGQLSLGTIRLSEKGETK